MRGKDDMTTPPTLRIPLPDILATATRALELAGCDEANACATAQVMAAAERDGCPAHGLFRLAGYLASLRSGKADGRAMPTTEALAPAVIRIDGHGGLAPLAMSVARETIAPLARAQGIAAAAITNVHHFSALWTDIETLVEGGLAAFCFTSYLPVVAPAGAKKPFFGTNPMAFGWPRPGGAFIFDQASAATARGDIQIAARDGVMAPPNAGIGPDGAPTRDPHAILTGAQLPFGGHKGSALALMIELLAGPLLGQPYSAEAARADNNDGGPPRGGVLLIALDPARFGAPQSFSAHGEQFFAELCGLDGVRLPGNRRLEARAQSLAHGVAIDAALWAQTLDAAHAQ